MNEETYEVICPKCGKEITCERITAKVPVYIGECECGLLLSFVSETRNIGLNYYLYKEYFTKVKESKDG